jgi:hypothetical protein
VPLEAKVATLGHLRERVEIVEIDGTMYLLAIDLLPCIGDIIRRKQFRSREHNEWVNGLLLIDSSPASQS